MVNLLERHYVIAIGAYIAMNVTAHTWVWFIQMCRYKADDYQIPPA